MLFIEIIVVYSMSVNMNLMNTLSGQNTESLNIKARDTYIYQCTSYG
jgi:hypothetical protein